MKPQIIKNKTAARHLPFKAEFVALIIVFGNLIPAHAALTDGLLSYWPLEANDAGVTADIASGNTMTSVGSPVVGPGRFGNAFTFDGSTTYLTNLHTPDNALTGLPIYRAGSYTITMWVKGAAQTARYLYSEGNTAGNNAPLLILQTGQAAANNSKFDVIIRTDGNVLLVNHVVSSNVVFDNNWHHIGWVDNLGSVRVYIDGNLDPANFSYTPSGTFTFHSSVIGNLVRAAVSTTGFFNGQIDDVALWERALSQAEVQEMMTNSLPSSLPPQAPFIVVQPAGATRAIGDRITFNVRAAGTHPFTYQWYKGNGPLLDATASSLTLSNLTVPDSGDFSVVVSNASGSVTSLVATLTVQPDPPSDLRQGIVSHWPMDLINDNMGQLSTPDLYSRNDFRLITTNFFDQAVGRFGSAIAFNGTEQYGYRVGGFPIFNNPSFTVAMWVNGNGVGQSDRRFFAESSTNTPNPLFVFGTQAQGTNGTVRVFIRNDANALQVDRPSTRTVLDGTWHHVVWTETNGRGKLYIDGGLDETDYTYTRSGIFTLDQTAVGAIKRATPDSFFAGALDDVAVWSRALTFTEIQEILTNSIPPPIMVIPPMITLQPQSQSVLTRSRVTFTFTASGTSPLDAQWRKDGTNLLGEKNSSLVFSNVMLGDAGEYTVVVTNSAGSVTSQVAVLTVTLRPPPGDTLYVDFNNNGADDIPANTETGFSSFSIPSFGVGPFAHSFGGVDVTLTAIGTTMESRKRLAPVNSGAFTEEKLLQDFVFTRDAATDQGLDVFVGFMEPNTPYRVSIWSFDTGSTGNNRISDWTANGTPVVTGYSFNGTALPSDNNTYRFKFDTTSDANGHILIQGRRNASAAGAINVFINALQVSKRQLRIVSIEFPTPFDITLTIDALDPMAAHHVQQKVNLEDTWADMPDDQVSFGPPNGTLIQATFAIPMGATRFYRVVEDP